MIQLNKISPNFYQTKLVNSTAIDDFIDVYEDRINGWYLDWAKKINGDENQ